MSVYMHKVGVYWDFYDDPSRLPDDVGFSGV